MFQFPRCPSCTYGFSTGCHLITDGGFPHSDTPGSQPAYGSPRHFGVRPVLLRHLTPRHPPCALITLSLRTSHPRRPALSRPHALAYVLSYAHSLVSSASRSPRVWLVLLAADSRRISPCLVAKACRALFLCSHKKTSSDILLLRVCFDVMIHYLVVKVQEVQQGLLTPASLMTKLV